MAHRYQTNTSHDPALQRSWQHPASPHNESSSVLRPLSDIRELTEPSIPEILPLRTTAGKAQVAPTPAGPKPPLAIKRGNSVRIVEPSERQKGKQRAEPTFFSSDTSTSTEASSLYSFPPNILPKLPPKPRTAHLAKGITVQGHTFPQAPVRSPPEPPVHRASERETGSASQTVRRVSKTFIRSPCPFEIVDQPVSRHSRVTASLQTVAPMFVGGGSIEGFVHLVIDGTESLRQRRALQISSISVDLIGIEELVGQHRRSVFLCLATELIHTGQPPPAEMIESTINDASGESVWNIRPSRSSLPFRISLPLDVGPAPFMSRTARIRYMLSVSIRLIDTGRPLLVRTSQDLTVLSTYDPEKALRSLPSPLTAFDEIHMAKHGRVDAIRLTAGLHRQVWVSGTSLFVDVHITNNSQKRLKKLELSIERDILYYRHAAAATLEKSASQARIFQDKEQTILSRSTLKPGWPGWDGVAPHGTLTRTCDVELPRGHSTVRCGKFFEVRYFLNVTIGTSHIKYLSVQLPIILIHMNSLDIVPNAVDQVAAAIEEKRTQHRDAQARKVSASAAGGLRRLGSNSSAKSSRSRPPESANLQGKAFAAPRQQSLERLRAQETQAQSEHRHRHGTGRRSPGPTRQRSHRTGRPPDARTGLRHDFALPPTPAPAPTSAGLGSFAHLNSSSSSLPLRRPSTQRHDISGTVRRTITHMRSFESFRRRRPSGTSSRPSSRASTTSPALHSTARPASQTNTRTDKKSWKAWLARKKPDASERSGWL